jgi:F420-dependent oxidoreductase-like protein
MRFALMIEPQQGLSYEEVLAVARTAEDVGFEALFRSDHFASFPGAAGQPTTDAWTTMAGLARETTRIRLGSLVSPVTFRIPGQFAKQVVTVDEMSGHRVEVGVGIGWNEDDHFQLGLPFPGVGERFEMLEEQLQIFRGLWREPAGWTLEGRHWQVRGSLFAPRPVRADGRPGLYVLLGGDGKPRALRLTATYADEYNIGSARPDHVRQVKVDLARACEAVGRDPGEVILSAMTGILVAANEAELRDRVRAQLAMFGDDPARAEQWLDERRSRWIMGTPDEALERIEGFRASGVQRLMLQDFLPRDLEMIRFIGESILPKD